MPRDLSTRQGGRHRPAALRHCANIRQAPDIINRRRRFYDSSAVLKSTRGCTMLGSSVRRVGLIDITVGNATRLGASQRSATRRSASHHIATQRLSRWGSPAARAFSADGLLKRLWLREGHVKRNICERMNSPLRDVPCSNADIDLRLERDLADRHHRIPTNQSAHFSYGHLPLAQFDFSQKPHKVSIQLGLYC